MNASRFLGPPHGSTPRSGDPSGSDRRFKASWEPVGSEITQDPRERTRAASTFWPNAIRLTPCVVGTANRRTFHGRPKRLRPTKKSCFSPALAPCSCSKSEVVAHDHDGSRGALDDPAERGQQIRLGGIGEIDRVDAAIGRRRSTPAPAGRPRTPPERRRSPTPGDSSSRPRRPRPSPRGTAGRTCTA